MAIEFSNFDRDSASLVSRRHLPHFEQPDAIYFVTFRLADTLPWEKVRRWKYEREQWLAANPPPHGPEQTAMLRKLVPERVHKYLDAGHGECLLRSPASQNVVEGVLRFGDGTGYRLGEFVVMPNHVHVLVQPTRQRFAKTVPAWKSISSRRINKLLGRQGKLWQDEPFDHIIRNQQKLEAARQYIRDNPNGLPRESFRLGCGTLH